MKKLSRTAIRAGAAVVVGLAAVSASIEPSAAAASSMVIERRDGGGPTRAMSQPEAQAYLLGVLRNQKMLDKEVPLKQALNQAFDGGGKPTGAYKFKNRPVLHASSGNGQRSATLFYYSEDSRLTLFAIGEHKTNASYKITVYGQRGTDFAEGKIVSLN
ncbi:hypothetical protein [Streptomyces cinnamoneus]|uniref:Uncharacterized protein n=1 Tax=Streptomyces cinnamoneus TaxID=53446 RepID=A0A918TCQ4_STRCJ|nr:hypothetical protein [Streptomyces cinnamoneus]GHC38740.1 hypothetical protein GCM10010507_10430 [Streptomyces cinnamoneus]